MMIRSLNLMSNKVFAVKMMVLAWIYGMIFHRMNSLQKAAASLKLSACCSSSCFSFPFDSLKFSFSDVNTLVLCHLCYVWSVSRSLSLSGLV